MPQDIQFVHDWFAEVETTPGRMRQVAYRKGTSVRAEVCPAGRDGKIELADLLLADGTIARHIPFAHFAVVNGQTRAA